MAPDQTPWLPYDPTWLIDLAKLRLPEEKWLHEALRHCTRARQATCCLPKVCGYYFVDRTNPNQPGSEWQFLHSVLLERYPSDCDVAVDILQGQRVGAVEFL